MSIYYIIFKIFVNTKPITMHIGNVNIHAFIISNTFLFSNLDLSNLLIPIIEIVFTCVVLTGKPT